MDYKRGFTLIELLISISIITFLTGSVAFSYRNSNDRFVVTSAAQEMAIAVRQAQSYGLSVRESGIGTGTFSYAYGIYASPLLDNTSYYIFIDRNANGLYDVGTGNCGSSTTECLEKIVLRNRVVIQQVCTVPVGLGDCVSAFSGSLYITFLRPNPDAYVDFYDLTNTLIINNASNGKFKLVSPQGVVSGVKVDSTGQVYVN